MKGKVCVFGSFNLDIVAGMARFPQPGESLIARNSMMGAGGKGPTRPPLRCALGQGCIISARWGAMTSAPSPGATSPPLVSMR